MKNKKQMAVIGAAAGVCILGTAAFASYQTANGYDALKKSLLSTIDYKNCTLSASMDVSGDGNDLLNESFTLESDLENGLTHTRSSTTHNGENTYASEDFHDSEYWYNVPDLRYSNAEQRVIRYNWYNSDTNLWGVADNERDTVNKLMRFAELSLDTVVGDLRNNFICTEDNDESASYTLTLDSVQIPEIINAGLSVIFSMSNNYGNETYGADPQDLDYYLSRMGNDPIVDSMTMNYTIGKDGMFRDGDMSITFTGSAPGESEHSITFNIKGGFTDVGSTVVPTIDSTGLPVYYYNDEGILTPLAD